MDTITMSNRFEALKYDTKIGYQCVETHEDAIVAAFERLDTTTPAGGPLDDRPLHLVRTIGHYAYGASLKFGLDRDELFLFGLSVVDFETMRIWDWHGDLADAYNAAQG